MLWCTISIVRIVILKWNFFLHIFESLELAFFDMKNEKSWKRKNGRRRSRWDTYLHIHSLLCWIFLHFWSLKMWIKNENYYFKLFKWFEIEIYLSKKKNPRKPILWMCSIEYFVMSNVSKRREFEFSIKNFFLNEILWNKWK